MKLTLSAIIATLLLALPAGAQISNPSVIPVPATPTSCSTLPLKVVNGTANLYGTNGSGGCSQIGTSILFTANTWTSLQTYDAGLASASDGVHPGYIRLYGNTTAPSIDANTVGELGPPVATYTAWASQPAASTSGGPTQSAVLEYGVTSSGVSQYSFLPIATSGAALCPLNSASCTWSGSLATQGGSPLVIQTSNYSSSTPSTCASGGIFSAKGTFWNGTASATEAISLTPSCSAGTNGPVKDILGATGSTGLFTFAVQGGMQLATIYATASLPTCASGTLLTRLGVNDATSAVPGAAPVGGGTYTVPVVCIENSTGPVFSWIID